MSCNRRAAFWLEVEVICNAAKKLAPASAIFSLKLVLDTKAEDDKVGCNLWAHLPCIFILQIINLVCANANPEFLRLVQSTGRVHNGGEDQDL